MELVKFQEKLDKIYDTVAEGFVKNEVSETHYRVFNEILDCLEELSLEISKINDEK